MVNTRLGRLYEAPEADGWKEPQVKQEDCPDDRDPVLSANPGDTRSLLHIPRAAGPVRPLAGGGERGQNGLWEKRIPLPGVD